MLWMLVYRALVAAVVMLQCSSVKIDVLRVLYDFGVEVMRIEVVAARGECWSGAHVRHVMRVTLPLGSNCGHRSSCAADVPCLQYRLSGLRCSRVAIVACSVHAPIHTVSCVLVEEQRVGKVMRSTQSSRSGIAHPRRQGQHRRIHEVYSCDGPSAAWQRRRCDAFSADRAVQVRERVVRGGSSHLFEAGWLVCKHVIDAQHVISRSKAIGRVWSRRRYQVAGRDCRFRQQSNNVKQRQVRTLECGIQVPDALDGINYFLGDMYKDIPRL
ncbi:hypothetical protein EJ03DRAFT_146939 [Teratosphaeria nubilosa]|uniref:Secreted protein n=1 Tax=Teratosphaeria nubilosa TaxID=161662 RepID=A0A6G1L3R2_9PEZI|nr:hypothetical protein EJ03DRAFT_146939 [Teratosphaeria nubilosa]